MFSRLFIQWAFLSTSCAKRSMLPYFLFGVTKCPHAWHWLFLRVSRCVPPCLQLNPVLESLISTVLGTQKALAPGHPSKLSSHYGRHSSSLTSSFLPYPHCPPTRCHVAHVFHTTFNYLSCIKYSSLSKIVSHLIWQAHPTGICSSSFVCVFFFCH